MAARGAGPDSTPTASAKSDRASAKTPAAADVVQEIELALAVAPEAMAALRNDPQVRALAIDRAKTKRLVSTYYDNDTLDLFRNDLVLRVRRIGRKYIQGIKQGRRTRAGMAVRDELEWAVDSASPEWPVRAPGPFAEALGRAAARGLLRQVFETDIQRTSRRLALPDGSVVDLAIDQGTIRAGDRETAVSEIELELVSGDTKGIYDLALSLSERHALRLVPHSKGVRGYMLVHDLRQKSVSAAAAALTPQMPVNEALSSVIAGCAEQAVANVPSILAGSDVVEGVHQMRVALRRFRAALTMFNTVTTREERSELKREVKRTAAILGHARDLDVFATETLPPIVAAHPTENSLQVLARRVQALRESAHEAVAAHLESPTFARLWLRVGAWNAGRQMGAGPVDRSQKPLGKLACKVLAKRDKAVRALGDRLDEISLDDMHELRIRVKQLRYAAEFFAQLYGRGKTARVLKRLRRLQDALGWLNDAVVAHTLLTFVERNGLPGEAVALARASGLITGRIAVKLDSVRDDAAKAYRKLAAEERFWRT